MKLILYFLIVTGFFIIWIEYSVTNILFRYNDQGIQSLNLQSLFYYLLNPLYKETLWTFNTLDINYIFVLLYSYLIYLIFTSKPK
jgi:hypothetical protein